ncbi:MAG: hypothetical protein WCA81_12685 [Rhizomicrobium sp.]|jgi:hypothetical protein
MTAGDTDRPEVYIEFIVQGGLVKVTAIDSVTGTEVCVFGPVTAPREALTQNAVAKLEYVLRKQKRRAGEPRIE